MKIASMVRAYIQVPRPADIVYAPIDLAMAICEGLAAKGHSVDFYGPEGSTSPVPIKSLGLKPLVHSQVELQALVHNTEMQMHYVPELWDHYYARDMFEAARRGEYDLLHFHHPESALAFAPLYPDVPVVYTLHDPIEPWYQQVLEMHQSPNQFFVSISNSQRRAAKFLPYIATVYNGIHLKDFPFSATATGDYLLYAGRIVPDKGVAEAVQVARRTKSKLLIVGPVYSDTLTYFNKRIKPYLSDDIKYLGYIERDKLATYMQGAKALLMPVKWEEPFGVSMIEAMASGTPVIGMRRGSIPEVIKNSVTGFVVDNTKEMSEAVRKIDTINRQACRKDVEERFSVQIMVNGYEAAFEAAIKLVKNTK